MSSFMTSVIDDGTTFTSRASTGTYYDSNGILRTAPIDVARNSFNPSDLTAPSRLLVEGQRTNLLTHSYYDDAAGSTPPTDWTIAFGTATTTTTASEIFDGSIVASHTGTLQRAFYNYAGINITNGVVYTLSVYLHEIDTVDSCIGTNGLTGGEVIVPGADITSKGWFSVSFTAQATETISIRIGLGVGGNATGTVTHELPQLEVGSYASSFIPTTSAPVTRSADVTTSSATTRSADVAYVDGDAFQDFYNQSEGSVVCKYQTEAFNADGNQRIFSLEDNTGYNYILHRCVGGYAPDRFISVVKLNNINIVNNESSGYYTLSDSSQTIYSLSFINDDLSVNRDGSLEYTNNSFSLPTNLKALYLGTDYNLSGQLNGTIQYLTYYDKRLTDAELQALTTE